MKKTQEYVDVIWNNKDDDTPRAIILQNGHVAFLKVTKMRKDDVSQLLTDLLEKEEKIHNEPIPKKIPVNARLTRPAEGAGFSAESL